MMVRSFSLSLLALLVLLPGSPAIAEVKAQFLHPLSNFSGSVPSLWARLAIDAERNEIYALNQRANDIRIFDEHGMEIFVFGEGFPMAADLAIGRDGDMFLLATGYQTASIHRLNYRGEHVAEIVPTDIPAAFAEFVAGRLEYRDGRIYLVDSDRLMVVVIDERGVFKRGYDLNIALRPSLPRDDRADKTIQDKDWAEEKLEFIALDGFSVDAKGNLYFTVASLFSAYRMSPDGELEQFGKPGSAPGKFGVAAGIVSDDSGYVYVADRLRSVVMVFDPSLTFQTEFGYRGGNASNLIVPDDLAIDRRGHVYVAQAANRGVSVFRVVHDEVVDEPVVHEIASPIEEQDIERSSTVSEKTSQTVEEDVSDSADSLLQDVPAVESVVDEPDQVDLIVDVPGQAEFIVDQGGDLPSADSKQPGWIFEENEADHLEENRR